MKYLIVFVAVISAAVGDEAITADEITRLRTISTECETSSKVAREKLTDMRKHKHFDDDDQHLKDYMFCVFKKIHWMNEDGTVDAEHLKKDVHRSTDSLIAMRHCKETKGSNGPELAYNIYKCYLQHLPADYKHPLYKTQLTTKV
nr:general odorant-binding protein 56d-like [Onthophagus taurus]